MAGYSKTPLAKKLGIREGSRIRLRCAPAGFPRLLGTLPPEAKILARIGKQMDVIVLFVRRRTDLERHFQPLAESLSAAGMLWVGWPKKSSGVATDLSFDVVQGIGLASGLVDNKICALDETWSGLRFVYRLKDRGGRIQ